MKKYLLITDNSNLDTSYDAIIMYARAEYNFIQKKHNNSMLILDSILDVFINHSIKDEIHLLKSNIYINQQDYESAIKELKKIIDNHYYDILGDEALFKYANILYEIYDDNKQAMNIYNKIIIVLFYFGRIGHNIFWLDYTNPYIKSYITNIKRIDSIYP